MQQINRSKFLKFMGFFALAGGLFSSKSFSQSLQHNLLGTEDSKTALCPECHERHSTGHLWIGHQKDTNLYRESCANLKTDGNFTVAGKLNAIATSAYFADYAEYFECDENLETGSAVSITGYRKVGKYNGKNFAGFVSENPGMVIGDHLIKQGKKVVPVAFCGSVNIKVHDENIKCGDELTITADGSLIKVSSNADRVIAVAQEDNNLDKMIMALVR